MSSDSGDNVPGDTTKMTTKMMDMQTSLMQNFKPISNVCQHVCGVHFYDGDLKRQVIAHHYCSHLNEDVRQCVIYDSPDKNGRLIGVEYIISAKLFEQLPPEEKKYWHSHVYEVKSGALVAPSVPELAEHMDMEKLVNTYGKTWHFWQVDRDHPLPYGTPSLMMSLTADGQADLALMAEKDKITGISTKQRKAARADIPEPTILKGADVGIRGENNGSEGEQQKDTEPPPAKVKRQT